MQCACAILPSMALTARQYFSTVAHKRHDFRKKNEYQTYDLFALQLLSEKFLNLRRIERDMIKKYIGLHSKYPLFKVRVIQSTTGVVSGQQPGHFSGLTAPKLQPTANQERGDQCGNQHYSRELLMMGIVVPDTC